MAERSTKQYLPAIREFWGYGPWQAEPDEVAWIDDMTGYRCLIQRNSLGCLAGYVAVPQGHAAYGKTLSLRVHGGITYAGMSHPHQCDQLTNWWWFGFHCAHGLDYKPAIAAFASAVILPAEASEDDHIEAQESLRVAIQQRTGISRYATIEYVERQVNSLVEQLHTFDAR